MSNILTCKALKLVCGEEILYYELSEVIYLDRMKKLYVCVGRHSLYLLKRNMRRTISGGKLGYWRIDGIYEDVSNDTRFLILFDKKKEHESDKNELFRVKKEVGEDWVDDKLFISCLNRLNLCNHIELAWRTDTAYRTGKYFDFPKFGIDLFAIETGKAAITEGNNGSKKRRNKNNNSALIWAMKEVQGDNRKKNYKKKQSVGRLDFKTTESIRRQLRAVSDKGYSSTIYPLVKAEEFIDYKKYVYNGYFFFGRKGFENKATQVYSSQTGSYISYSGVEMSIDVQPQVFLNHKKPSTTETNKAERKNIKYRDSENDSSLCGVAQEHIRFLSNTTMNSTYYIYINNKYTKKMNLSDDISTWYCWELFMKTTKASIACIVMRRCYIPPTLDSYQDISVVYSCSYKDMKQFGISDRDILRECRLTADSVSPISQHHTFYIELVKSQLDALLFDEYSYNWIEKNIKLHPVFRKGAKSFLKSILVLLEKANSLVDVGLIEEIDLLDKTGSARYENFDNDLTSYGNDNDGVEVFEDPMMCIQEMLVQVFGIDKFSKSLREKKKFHFFELRLARYLSYCIDGGLLGPKFILEDLISSVGTSNKIVDRKIMQVLDYLLHVRSKDMNEDYVHLKLIDLLKDSRFVKKYLFVPKVMARFVNTGYCARLIPSGQEITYVEFLMNLLTIPGKNSFGQKSQLKISILQQILHASGDPKKRDYYAQMVPILVEIFSGKGEGDDNTVLKYAGAVLLNLSHSSGILKDELVNSGISSVLVEKLYKRDDLQLTKICISIAVNVSKNSSHRKVLLGDGILPPVADILHELLENFNSQTAIFENYNYSNTNSRTSNYSPNSDWDVLPVLLGLIGQLSNESDIRSIFVTKWCVLDYLLYLFHNIESYVGKDNDLVCRILFCVKQLTGSDWTVQLRVGKHCIPSLIEIIATPHKAENQKILVPKFSQYISYWTPEYNSNTYNNYYTSLYYNQKNCGDSNSFLLSGINGDIIYQSLLLLETLSYYHPNCFEMVSCGIRDAIETCMESFNVDTIVIKLNYLREIINKVTLEL
ncbi:hypothetical protein FG379_002094 [Cryptosporidium bovis]|uniref:uncharacterized protein n=1 Tax=Cryptosporidium bovis TaxID=310047 RepID=UPI003519E097|nr:hypothetical protein FG379_002094 [Cryptosporidium bovis]